MQMRIIGAGIFFLFVFLSGYRLNHSGAPYSTLILTIHKLIALAAGALLIIVIYRSNQVAPPGSLEWGAILVTAAFFIGTVVTGGLMSTGKVMPAVVSRLHQIAPFLTIAAGAATLYLLLGEPRIYVTLLP